MNLTAIRDPVAIVQRHFGESLFLATLLPPGPATVADVGSGAGFPGFPVAVLHPDLEVTLVESVTKKAMFLKEVARNVPNVRVARERFETLPGHFAWLITRAVRLDPKLFLKADRVAILTSSSGNLPRQNLTRLELHPLPWNPSLVVAIGDVSRETFRILC